MGPLSESDGIQHRQSASKMLVILSVGMPTLRYFSKPVFHEAMVILVPLEHRVFPKVIFSMYTGYVSVSLLFFVLLFYTTFYYKKNIGKHPAVELSVV